ncbi:hypothetical protein LTR53_008455 [Teratosphaeriaceae sp. CCFEE 6253]|nr:hypothetical protein LTR53_008455 [Teratosphaeriaceae sp. CCFEE 6253]
MSSKIKVAIITGGASGIGLAVGEALVARGDWNVFLLDRDSDRGNTAAKKIGATFAKADVTDYTSLAGAFKIAFQAHQRVDFVFANAGIALAPPDAPAVNGAADFDAPPEPNTSLIDINLKGTILTSQLALHYLGKSSREFSPGSLIITASSAGFYLSQVSPAYSASKHGVVGWARSIAPAAWRENKARINAICPGIVRTNILPDAVYQMFPNSMLTPVSKVTEVVLLLLDNESVNGGPARGQTVEICGANHYFREQIEYCDATMQALMGAGAPAE